jgi:hypothetical protein
VWLALPAALSTIEAGKRAFWPDWDVECDDVDNVAVDWGGEG